MVILLMVIRTHIIILSLATMVIAMAEMMVLIVIFINTYDNANGGTSQ